MNNTTLPIVATRPPKPKSKPKPVTMVFCAYCGQSFKRKEHLERHLPSHTNVKPYKCDSCQLSFARRDLLQKHHTTYHEPSDYTKRGNGEPPPNTRTPIACLNCATAKAGCDKKVPCARCTDKNLPCAPRFARRSSKGTFRPPPSPSAAQISQQNGSPTRTSQEMDSVAESHLDGSREGSLKGSQSQQDLLMWGSTHEQCIDPSQGIQLSGSPFDVLSKHQDNFGGVGTILGPNGDFKDFDAGQVDMETLNMWSNCSMDIDMCANNSNYDPNQVSINGFWYPDQSHDGLVTSLPSPPSTTSTSHSRIASISPTWPTQPEPQLQDLASQFVELTPGVIPELELVIASEEAWPLAKCNPRVFSGNCPRTAIVHLEALQDCSKLDGAWNSMNDMMAPTELNRPLTGPLAITPITTTTRDKIVAFAQSFLLKAIMTHHTGRSQANSSGPSKRNFFTLPPSNVLENLLRCSVRSLSGYYSLIHGTHLDPNELMLDNDTSTLLFLLMMAQGASTVPKAEARYLAAGLTETCRISLFDVIEKNVELSADPVVLKSAFLFTQLGAWGGDAWRKFPRSIVGSELSVLSLIHSHRCHMMNGGYPMEDFRGIATYCNILITDFVSSADIKQAMGQRGMYLVMLKHSGLLEPQPPMLAQSNFNDAADVELRWREWLRCEHIYRLVYNWSMLDQELSLFHDTAPILSITDFQTPLPCSERLWRAQNSIEWLKIIQETRATADNSDYHSPAYPQESLSLSHLFQDMLRDELEIKNRQLSPFRLKLLLHPLQSLVNHLGQLLSCFYGMHDNQQNTRPLTTASTLMRLEEVQSSLHKWYDIAMTNHRADPNCPITNGSLVLYHLIYLNTVTYFPEIERLVRKEGSNGSSWETALRSKQLIYQPEKAIFHCGQVLRIVSNMPETGRPAWWSAALYRVSMILWVDGLSRAYGGENLDKGSVFMINSTSPDDPAIKSYLCNVSGIPAILKRDGSFFKLGNPDHVLSHCLSLLGEGVPTRFSDGIRRKMQTLLRNWKTI